MKKLILLGAVLAAFTAAFLYVPRASLAPHTISPTSSGVGAPTASVGAVSATTDSTSSTSSGQASSLRLTTNAALKVGTTTYPIAVTSGETVVEAMRALAAASAFTFTGRDYPSLGFFVDSINGEKNVGGRYWMLYVNGISASSGASSVVVKPGDTVEWRYEQSY